MTVALNQLKSEPPPPKRRGDFYLKSEAKPRTVRQLVDWCWGNHLQNVFVTAFIILVFTIASFFSVNQYRFGIADQSIMIPFVKVFVNKSLYPNDYVLPQRLYYHTFLWNGLGFAVKNLNLNISTVFFLTYFLSLYLTFLAIYLISIILFKERRVAFLTLFFLLFTKPTLAGAATLENILLARTVALPILLFSMYFFLKESYFVSFFLLGIGFLIHPLSSGFVTTGLVISSLISLKKIGIRRFLLSIGVFIISASPILIWKLLYTRFSWSLLYADPQWIEVLRLRLSHHLFPLSWSKDSFFQAGLVLLTFFITWKHQPKLELHRFVMTFSTTILAIGVIGIIFSEFVPLSIILNFQVLRSFKFILYFAMIYFANYFLTEIKLKKNIFDELLVAFFSIGILYGATGWKYVYVAFFILAVFLIFYYSVFRKEPRLRFFLFLLISIVLVLSIGAYFQKGGFSIANAQEKKWLDVQKWAKKNTDYKDLFIVPYNSEGFRIESERSIYGDWKDGCLAVFNQEFAHQWLYRMKKLGFKKELPFDQGFKNLNEKDFIAIANQMVDKNHKVFLVMFKERRPLNFPLVYENEKFVVYEVSLHPEASGWLLAKIRGETPHRPA